MTPEPHGTHPTLLDLALWSVRQTFKWFHDHALELPVGKFVAGRPKLVWQLPTLSFLSNVLRNAFYAGAYVWGRRPIEMVLVEGRLRERVGWMRPPGQCSVFLREHHEGYIDWASYQENQRMKRRSWRAQGGADVGHAGDTPSRGRLTGDPAWH